MGKTIIYQVLPRLFGNRNTTRKRGGTVAENGCGKLEDFDAKTLKRIMELGVTHVWFTGVIRHATLTDYTRYGIPLQHDDVVKGRAGSPYAIADYYDIDPDLAVCVEKRMEEFEALVARCHKLGLKVIIDFVPNHVAREYKSVCKPDGVRDLGEGDDTNMHFSTSNNFYYCWGNALNLSAFNSQQTYCETPARATGNDHFDHCPGQNDWYETVKLNYGIDYCDAGGRSEHFSPVPNTWEKMRDIMMFWADKGIDGLRCDMAEMVPAAFWRWATGQVKEKHKGFLFVGEVYDPWQYRTYIQSGFDYLYDKVGMYDCLYGVMKGWRSAKDITRQWQSTDDIRSHMLYFLENHDEVRLASDELVGDASKAVPAHIFCSLFQNNPYMVYFGQELGERGMDDEGFSGMNNRTTIFDYWSLDSVLHGYFNRNLLKKDEKALYAKYKKVLRIAQSEKAITEGQTYDLMYANEHLPDRVFAFLRKAGKETVLVAVNFGNDDQTCAIHIPTHAFEYLDMAEHATNANELLTETSRSIVLQKDGTVEIAVPAYGGAVLKWG